GEDCLPRPGGSGSASAGGDVVVVVHVDGGGPVNELGGVPGGGHIVSLGGVLAASGVDLRLLVRSGPVEEEGGDSLNLDRVREVDAAHDYSLVPPSPCGPTSTTLAYPDREY